MDEMAPEWGPLYAFQEALETRAAKVCFNCCVARPVAQGSPCGGRVRGWTQCQVLLVIHPQASFCSRSRIYS